MTDLKSEIEALLERLKAIDNVLKTLIVNQNTTIHADNYKVWIEKVNLAKGLENVLPVISIRGAAEKTLAGLVSSLQGREFESLTSAVTYGGASVPVSDARILALDAYLAGCWSLYDRLANIIGRVIGSESIRHNPLGRGNPKLVETFLAVKQGIDVLGVKDVIAKSYGNQIRYSYLMRNCYMHEGGMIQETPILGGTTVGEAFIISEQIAEKLNTELESLCKMQNTAIARAGDIVEQLKECHAGLDAMFISLLHFMMGTLFVEIEAFAEIDGFRIEE